MPADKVEVQRGNFYFERGFGGSSGRSRKFADYLSEGLSQRWPTEFCDLPFPFDLAHDHGSAYFAVHADWVPHCMRVFQHFAHLDLRPILSQAIEADHE